jgi:hypothetical protein
LVKVKGAADLRTSIQAAVQIKKRACENGIAVDTAPNLKPGKYSSLGSGR